MSSVFAVAVLMAVVCKEALKIYGEHTVLVFLESNSQKKSFITVLSHKERLVDTAKVYKIKSSAAHNEESLKIIRSHRGGEIVEHSALVGKSELADPGKHIVDCGGICHKIGIVFHIAFFADKLLLGFCLYR